MPGSMLRHSKAPGRLSPQASHLPLAWPSPVKGTRVLWHGWLGWALHPEGITHLALRSLEGPLAQAPKGGFGPPRWMAFHTEGWLWKS